jgi:hypothetical protein
MVAMTARHAFMYDLEVVAIWFKDGGEFIKCLMWWRF